MDWSIWFVFAIELLLAAVMPWERILSASTAVKLAVVVLSFPQLPIVLGLVRLARLGRLLRLMRLMGLTARGVAVIKEILGRRGLICVAAVTTLLILVGEAEAAHAPLAETHAGS